VFDLDIVACGKEGLPCSPPNCAHFQTCPDYDYRFREPREQFLKTLECSLRHQFHHPRGCGCSADEIIRILQRIPTKINGKLRNNVQTNGYGMLAVRRWALHKWLIAVAISQLGPVIFLIRWLCSHPGDLQNAFMLSMSSLAVLAAIVAFPDSWNLRASIE
jgi:hypothetical protein